MGQKGKQKGKPQPDSALRDTENVPLAEDIDAYFQREVLPHAPDAWIDTEKSKVDYEIPFNRHFYIFEPPRSLHAIDEELKTVACCCAASRAIRCAIRPIRASNHLPSVAKSGIFAIRE